MEDKETEAKPNAWRVYHVETGAALATFHKIEDLASHLAGLKEHGDAAIVRAVTADEPQAEDEALS